MWRENPALYSVAMQICHDAGIPWTDPRTGHTYHPPKRKAKKVKKRKAAKKK